MKTTLSNQGKILAVLALGAFAVGLATAQTTTTYSGANGAYNVDTWNNPVRWSAGVPTDPAPSPPWDVQIADNWHAGVALTTTPVYTGNLTLGLNSQLTIGEGATITGLRALGTGSITFNTGSRITLRWSTASTHSQNFIMSGDATFAIGSSTAAHNDDRTLTGVISGAGKLTVRSTNGQRLTIQNTNPSWSGGLIMGGALSENKNESLRANALGAFGTGDVTIDDGVGLLISVADAIDDAADLSLSGGDGEQTFKLTMDAGDTVNTLTVDGYLYPAGTYSKVGGTGTYKLPWIGGNSVLTVSSPTDSTAPTVSFAGTGIGGSSSSVYEDEPVTYTVTFSEPHTPALAASNLENSTGTAMTIVSVTPQPLTGGLTTVTYAVVVKATEPGSLNLRIKSDTAITDLAGNALVVPTADNDTLTVNAWPALQGELGVWKPWANGGINPATGNPWQAGDTYHIAFVTSGTRDATDPDISTYHTFVSNAATAAGIVGGTWYCIGQSFNNPTRNTNAPPMTTTKGIFLVNGAKLADTGADLADGPDVFFNITETDSQWNGNVATGSTRKFGDPGQTNIENGNSNRTDAGWWQVFNGAKTAQWHFYAVSAELTLQAVGGPGPEIAVEQPASTDIANGGSKDFGTVTIGSTTSLEFTIRNTGSSDLNLTGTPPDYVVVGGTNPGDFTVTAQPSTPVTSGGGTTTFTVQFAPGAAGARSATLTIANDDTTDGENPFVINVTGTGQTPYQAWAGSALFGDDANGDGVNNGLAFLLGAANPSANALDLLPAIAEDNGNLVLTFSCLNAAARGGAVLNVEYSNDLGLTDLWTANSAAVPGAPTPVVPPNAPTVINGVEFVVTTGIGNLVDVTATVDASNAADGKLFGRVSGQP